jgi:hypothetical protein
VTPPLTRRLARLHQSLPPPPVPPRELDFGRLSLGQLERREQWGERFAAVGISGLTDGEVVEIADLVAIVEKDAKP